jgi:hypothetical protein
VFVVVLMAVTNATLLLVGGLRVALALPTEGDIREPLSVILGASVIWAYHAFVLQEDAHIAGEGGRAAGVRRLYWYLVAAIGLAAFLIGLSGNVSVLIRALAETGFVTTLKEQFAWFTGALVAGLPVWLWQWRPAQAAAVSAGESGRHERHSLIRKIYLYAYLFVATMTILSSAVYIVYQVLGRILGAEFEGSVVSAIGQAIGFSLIAAGAWLYHGWAVREDGRLSQSDQAQRYAATRAVVLLNGAAEFDRTLLDVLRRDVPGLGLSEVPSTATELPAADVIVCAAPFAELSSALAQSVAASPARKVMLPTRLTAWEWAGVDRWDNMALAQQTAFAVKQLIEGEPVHPVRPLGAGAIFAIIFVVLILLMLSWIVIASLLGG